VKLAVVQKVSMAADSNKARRCGGVVVALSLLVRLL